MRVTWKVEYEEDSPLVEAVQALLEFLNEEGVVVLEFEADVTSFIPARTYGPPERYHPEEGGEVESLGIEVRGKDKKFKMLNEKIAFDVTQFLGSAIDEDALEQADEAAAEARDDRD